MRSVTERDPHVTLSVSCTTRPPRAGETDGVDYRFVGAAEFDRLVDAGAFLEWAEVFGHRYGTLRSHVEEELARGRDVLLEIDVQGARQVREAVRGAVLIFLCPPSEAELARRLRARRTEDDAIIARRLAEARRELAEASWFDHVVVNDDLERGTTEVAAILASHRERD